MVKQALPSHLGMTTKERRVRASADLKGLLRVGGGYGCWVGLVLSAAEGGEAAEGEGDAGPDEDEGAEGGGEGDGLAGCAEELAGVEKADGGAPAAASGSGGEGLPLEDAGVAWGEGERVAEDGLAVVAAELEGEGSGVGGGQAEGDAADAGGEREGVGDGRVELGEVEGWAGRIGGVIAVFARSSMRSLG